MSIAGFVIVAAVAAFCGGAAGAIIAAHFCGGKDGKKRLIDADKAIHEMQTVLDEHPNERNTVAYRAFEAIVDCLKREPTVDAVEVVHGRWEKNGKHDWRCSVCRIGVPYSFTGHSYCHNCGADMRERKDHGQT